MEQVGLLLALVPAAIFVAAVVVVVHKQRVHEEQRVKQSLLQIKTDLIVLFGLFQASHATLFSRP